MGSVRGAREGEGAWETVGGRQHAECCLVFWLYASPSFYTSQC